MTAVGRRAAVLGFAAVSLAGCFGSAPPPGGTEPPASDSDRPGNPAAACTDVRTLSTLNQQFGTSGNDLARAKSLLGRLVGTAGQFVADAPGTVVADARIYRKDVTLLAAATAKAKSITELNNRSLSDQALRRAATELGPTSKRISAWSAKHC
jgi:hypothetical protein